MTRTLHIVDAVTPRDALRQLAALAGPEDRIVSVGPPPEAPELAGRVEALHAPLTLAVLAGRRVRAAARDARTESLHAWSVPAARAGQLAAGECPGGMELTLPAAPSPAGGVELIRVLVRGGLTLNLPTEAARQKLLGRGAPPEAVRVVRPPMGPIPDRDRRRRDARAALGVDDGGGLLVAPAEMLRDAGHKYACWAHAICRHAAIEMRLWLPGGGPNERHVRFFAGTTGFDDEIFFTAERFALADVLAAADVACFFRSRDCGLAAPAAAMSAGLAIAATRTPDLLELFGSGTAILTPPNDPRAQAAALMRLASDASARAEIAGAARRRADELLAGAAEPAAACP